MGKKKGKKQQSSGGDGGGGGDADRESTTPQQSAPTQQPAPTPPAVGPSGGQPGPSSSQVTQPKHEGVPQQQQQQPMGRGGGGGGGRGRGRGRAVERQPAWQQPPTSPQRTPTPGQQSAAPPQQYSPAPPQPYPQQQRYVPPQQQYPPQPQYPPVQQQYAPPQPQYAPPQPQYPPVQPQYAPPQPQYPPVQPQYAPPQPQYPPVQPQYAPPQPQYPPVQPQYAPPQPQQPPGGQGVKSTEDLTKKLQSLSPPSSSSPQKTLSPTKSSALATLTGNCLTNTKNIKPGTQGTKMVIEVNHLRLDLGKLEEAYHYDITFNPDKPKMLLRAAMTLFQNKYYPKNFAAFDGRKNLYSARRLPFKDDQLSGSVTVQGENREREFKIDLKLVRTVDLRQLRENLTKHTLTKQEAMQCVDIVLRNAPSIACITAGRSFFTQPRGIIDLGDGMQLYHGFYQSAIRGWRAFLNVDVSHKAFPKEQPVLQLINDLAGRDQPDLARDLDRNLKARVEKYLKSLKIKYQLPNQPSSKRIYRVNGFSDSARFARFLANGKQTTVEEYFRKEKRINLQYPLLPTLWVGSRERENKVLLPIEFCTIEPGQVVQRKMTELQTRNMIRDAATSTTVRKQKIMESLRQARYNDDPCIREFGFSVSDNFEKLQARILTPPILQYGNRTVQVSKGQWRGERLHAGATIKQWTIVSFDRFMRVNEINNLATMLYNTAQRNGIIMENQALQPFEIISDNSIQNIISYFRKQKDRRMDLVFVIVPNSGPQYAYTKKAAELQVGCLTQCIKSDTVRKRCNDSTIVNILLKVNSKMSGKNHIWRDRPPIFSRPCMIMGADVTHPSPDAKDIPSVAAVTASFDANAWLYNICWRLQPPKVEIISDLEKITREQLIYFYKQTRVKPERIVFLRDGVSEGQFEQVLEAEISAIQRACMSLEKDYEPAIVFLVVQKRHHTRFFPTQETNPRLIDDKRNMNVPAGTCVDTEIVNPTLQDFYLVSHASIQGVAKPTKYVTLWDDIGLSNDDVQQLVYFLCHTFTRCNRAVSYPAPTYYAHLAAARGKVYIENERLNMDNLRREEERFTVLDDIIKGKPMFFV